jgi:hypothetical protein
MAVTEISQHRIEYTPQEQQRTAYELARDGFTELGFAGLSLGLYLECVSEGRALLGLVAAGGLFKLFIEGSADLYRARKAHTGQ